MQLSKTQVIALFLAGASANTPADLINANCHPATVAPGTLDTSMNVCSQMEPCTTNVDCLVANEECGTFNNGGAYSEMSSYCMHNSACNNIGKMGGVAWFVQCLNKNSIEAAGTDIIDPAALLLTVQNTITNTDAQVAQWTAATDMKIMAWDNYMTGWWIRGSDGIYTETDKPVINLCTTTADCTGTQCCANYPDTNNMRCIEAALGGVVKDLAPFTSWTPTCVAAPVDNDGPPISAEQDLANEALAQAAEQLTQFEDLMVTTLKETAGYDSLSDEDKAKFDTEWAAEKATNDEKEAADRLAAGYASMTTEQKTVFDAEMLKWVKAAWESCTEDEDSIECIKAWDLRDALEASRKTDGYYEKDSTARETFDAAQDVVQKGLKKTLVTAWIDSNKPAAGETGSSCSASNKCTNKDHCCGTATAGDKEITGVCASKTSKKVSFPKLSLEFSHVCGAKALIAGAATLFAAAYAM